MAKSKKKSELDVGKGFKRIYFSASAIWMIAWVIILFQDAPGRENAMHDIIIPSLFWILAPIPVYFILLFFIKGFKK
tara:strand:- start:30 stop:260 length:231 start_codon:yes stop_codon:yes gene_type:complete